MDLLSLSRSRHRLMVAWLLRVAALLAIVTANFGRPNAGILSSPATNAQATSDVGPSAISLRSITPRATNWQANIKPGSDIVMQDLRWPIWDAGTYYCFWYMSFFPKFSSLYGGVAVHGPDNTPVSQEKQGN